ncbi:MAG TPA: hypothetical protein VMV05_04675, partial [bacterium]|nr:hypothetical protein [bacterium]
MSPQKNSSGIQWSLDPNGVATLSYRGRVVAGALFALEMEVAGQTYRESWQGIGRNQCNGFLTDEKGTFLYAEASFRSLNLHGEKVIEERRTYQALRPLSKTLLTIRYYLEPVARHEEGFLVIPALWYGDNEAWNKKIIYPKGLEKGWSFRADGSSCPAVVWTTPKSSYALATNDSVGFSVKHPGLDDVLGIGFAPQTDLPQAVLTFPAQETPQSYQRARKLGKPLTPRMDWAKGQKLTITLYHSASESDRAYHTRVWRAHAERTPKGLRYPDS